MYYKSSFISFVDIAFQAKIYLSKYVQCEDTGLKTKQTKLLGQHYCHLSSSSITPSFSNGDRCNSNTVFHLLWHYIGLKKVI